MRRLLISLLLLLGCAGARDGHKSVVLIVVDTLRADALGCYGAVADPSPNIDALAGGGVRFDRCVSQAPWTLPSIATILTGLYPSTHGAGSFSSVLPAGLRTLTGEFRDAGYATGGVVSHRFVTKKKGFARGFRFFDESQSRNHDYVSSRGVTNIALRWLSQRKEDEPFFLFLHYFDPHYNYEQHDGFTATTPYDGPLRPGMDIWDLRKELETGSEEDVRYLRELYAGEIRFLDDQLGHLFDYLEESGRAENTVVVLTADHGEEFMEHGWLGHTRNLYGNLLRVPLIVRAPGLPAGAARRDPAMLVDLYPTIAKLAGLEVAADPERHGVDLFGERVADRALISEVDFDPENDMKARPKIVERESVKHAEMRAVQRGGWKAIEDRIDGDWELYRLADDPGEHHDRAAAEPDTLKRLQSVLAGWESSIERGEAETETLDSSDIEQLRSLGYVQ